MAANPDVIKENSPHGAYAKPVTVFEIPLLRDTICRHLSDPDIWSCCRVSKAWFQLFRSNHWRSVNLTKPRYGRSSTPLYLSQECRDSIVEHAHWIRSLTFNGLDANVTYFLHWNASPTTLTNLLYLDCRQDWSGCVDDDGDHTDENEDEGDNNEDDYVNIADASPTAATLEVAISNEKEEERDQEQDLQPSAFDLVHQNPRLLSLSVELCRHNTPHFRKAILPVLIQPNHPLRSISLSRLHDLRFTMSASCGKSLDIRTLLQVIFKIDLPTLKALTLVFDDFYFPSDPDKLERLVTKFKTPGNNDGNSSNSNNSIAVTATTPFSPTAIESVHFQGLGSGAEACILIPFIKYRCPNLKNLSAPSITHVGLAQELMDVLAARACPIQELHLNYDSEGGGRFVGQEARAFDRLTKNLCLTKLALDLGSDGANRVLPTVRTTSRETIRTLSLDQVPKQDHGKELVKILRECPRLTYLFVRVLHSGAEPRSSVELEDLVQEPWLCTGLTNLTLTITHRRFPKDLESTVPEPERVWIEGTVLLVRQLARMAKRMEKMEYLTFYWYGQPFRDASFRQILFASIPGEDGEEKEGLVTKEDLEQIGFRSR